MILVTGAAGVVGQALLKELDPGRVIALVHKNPVPDGRVESVQGDVSQPRLGLSESVYDELSSRIDCIVHGAAITEFSFNVEAISAANAGGTRRMLELAAKSGAGFLHVGTAFVATGGESESTPSTGRSALSVGTEAYRRSKIEAEAAVRESGLAHTVVRPSLLVGDSQTGEMARFQGLHTLLGYVFQGDVPFIPVPADARMDVIPQDVVGKIVAELVNRPMTGEMLWLTTGEEAPTLGELLELGHEVAERLGRPFSMPRCVDPEIIDRLVRPVFMDEFPSKIKRRLERVLEFNALVNPGGPLPSSLPELRERYGTGHLPDLRDAFVRNVEFWARETGFVKESAGV